MKFSEIKLGDSAEISHSITAEDISRFVTLSGDDNRLHIDKEYASQTYLKQPVAHGMLGASFISTIIGTKLPGDGALWMAQQLNFLKPARVGDCLTIRAEVIRKHERDEVIELSTDIFNQHNELLTNGFAKVKVINLTHSQNLDLIPNNKPKGTVLVVGGSGGIGSVICRKLSFAGFNIALHYNKNVAQAQKLCEEIRSRGNNALPFQADVTDECSVDKMVQQINQRMPNIIGFVFCPTPKLPTLNFDSLKWQNIQEQLEVNLKGLHYLCASIMPHLIASKYGKIVVFSTQTVDKPVARWAHYIAAKSALVGYVKSIALEHAPLGIRMNLVSPSMIDTELVADIPPRARLLIESSTPLKRMGTTDDVASAVSYLMGSESDFLTGETLRVNGGQVMV